ncbi:MAG TPA: hypothetical protein VMJ32_14550 [Pirellulales bacterium]|nr:hypothetical protein [Pirellulales bacterium]
MIRFRRFLMLALLAGALLAAAPGCSLFRPKQPEKPRTVEEWMAQKRVQP